MLFLRLVVLIGLASAALSAQKNDFEHGLYPILEKADCRTCHNADGVAAATRLRFPEISSPPEKIEAFGKSLVALVDREHPELSLLLKKPTARIAHVGGLRIKPGSPEESELRAWIDRLTRLSPAELSAAMRYREMEDSGGGAVASEPELRRLTHSQYNHTVRDLLGDQSTPSANFPPEDFTNGFRNQSGGQSLSPLLIEAYSAGAERLARAAFIGGDPHNLIPCKPSAACRSRFVREFGAKAFRRPLNPAEQSRYESLAAKETNFREGAQLVVEAMLQSPNFLFWMNATSDPRLRGWATASRLSYSLWDTMPDAELLAAAGRGDLSTREGVEKATRRMLADPRAKESLNEFVSQWLRFDRLLTASKDRRKFPLYTRETAVAMTEEARTFVSDLVWNKGNFTELFTAKYGFVSSELAGIYGVKAPPKDFERVPFPEGSERSGVLGQGLFLTLTAKPDDSSPTARGLFVREQFLCQHVPDPPAGVNTNLPPVTESKPQTNRDRISEHTTNPTCASCHKLIDPIGFGLEKFDAIGAKRDKVELKFAGEHKSSPPKIVNLAIDSVGNVAGIPDSQFSSPAELGAVLAKSAQCQECVVKQYFRYTAGRPETPADRPLLKKAFDDFRRSQFQFQELMISIALQREFPNQENLVHVASNHKSN